MPSSAYPPTRRASGASAHVTGAEALRHDFGYDASGNRTDWDIAAGPSYDYFYDSADQLTNMTVNGTTWSYYYDGNGAMTTATDGTVQWDYYHNYDGRLWGVNKNTSSVLTNAYNPDGTRRTLSNGGTINFVYDGQNVLAEYDSSWANPDITYTSGPGIDEPLVMTLWNHAQEPIQKTEYYLHYDALGSTRDLTDSNENTVTTYSYDAWGKTTESTIIGDVSCPFRYTGREWDDSGELYYYRTRYYDDILGRFLSREGLKRPDKPWTSPFVYVANSPVMYRDPMGRDLSFGPNGAMARTLWQSVPSQGPTPLGNPTPCPRIEDIDLIYIWGTGNTGEPGLCGKAKRRCLDRCMQCQDGERSQECRACCNCVMKGCYCNNGYCKIWDVNSGTWTAGDPTSSDAAESDLAAQTLGDKWGDFCSGYCTGQTSHFKYTHPDGTDEEFDLGEECLWEHLDPASGNTGIDPEYTTLSGNFIEAWFIKEKHRFHNAPIQNDRHKCGKICWYENCTKAEWYEMADPAKSKWGWHPTERSLCWLWVNCDEDCPEHRGDRISRYTADAQDWWVGNTFFRDYYQQFENTSEFPLHILGMFPSVTMDYQSQGWQSFLFEFDVMWDLYQQDEAAFERDMRSLFFLCGVSSDRTYKWSGNYDWRCVFCGITYEL